MGDGIQFLDIILFGAIAAFLILRLRSVLGRRSGHDQSPKHDPFRDRRKEDSPEDKVIQLPDRTSPGEAEDLAEAGVAAGTPVEQGLTQIKLADRSFDTKGFINGTKAAFEMIVSAFSQGDSKTLRPLLSNDVYDDFNGAIKAREERDETLESTLVGISEADIIEAELQGKTAFVTVKFITEQINVTRDAQGEAVNGDSG
ncbi:MAG: Tim44/TimA family putative adaptor protein, partial [Kiloniellales bacterium]